MIKTDKLFGDKKAGGIIYILLAMGIILLVMGSSADKAPSDEKNYIRTSRTYEAEEILSNIKGAGKVNVMISNEENKENSPLSASKPEKEEGVLIVADGGGNSAVCEKLVRAASVALGVSAHKIEVFERK